MFLETRLRNSQKLCGISLVYIFIFIIDRKIFLCKGICHIYMKSSPTMSLFLLLVFINTGNSSTDSQDEIKYIF